MCDFSSINVELAVAGIAIVAAIGFLVAAIALNGSFFGAPGAPIPMAAAAAASAVAAGALLMAVGALEECQAASGGRCSGEFANALAALRALATVLGIQATAALAAIGISWIPWAGGAAMTAIMATLILQLALIPNAVIMLEILKSCLEAFDAPTIGPVAVAVATGTLVLAAYFTKATTKKTID